MHHNIILDCITTGPDSIISNNAMGWFYSVVQIENSESAILDVTFIHLCTQVFGLLFANVHFAILLPYKDFWCHRDRQICVLHYSNPRLCNRYGTLAVERLAMKIGLTHWGRVTHICVGNLTTVCSDNGLSPGRRQASLPESMLEYH